MRLLTSGKSHTSNLPRPGAYIAQVSYSESSGFGALRASEQRDIPIFAPRGIRYHPAEGDNMLMITGEGRDVCAGVLSKSTGLLPGEMEICGPGGSYLKFRKNGEVVINGLTITKSGEMRKGEDT